jgi:hypothetical protein
LGNLRSVILVRKQAKVEPETDETLRRMKISERVQERLAFVLFFVFS